MYICIYIYLLYHVFAMFNFMCLFVIISICVKRFELWSSVRDMQVFNHYYYYYTILFWCLPLSDAYVLEFHRNVQKCYPPTNFALTFPTISRFLCSDRCDCENSVTWKQLLGLTVCVTC